MSEEAVMSENQESNSEESGSLLAPQAEAPAENQEPEAMPHLANDPEQPSGDMEDYEWGDRPDWIPEQFWSEKDGPDLEGLSKSYNELRTKFSQGKHKAPKDGNYDIASLKDHGIDNDDPLLNDFVSFSKENGLSQEQFDQITAMYMNHMGEMMDQADTNREAELAKLGPKGEKVVAGLNQWLTKLGQSGALSPEEVDAIASRADSATYIQALNKIRASYGEKTIPDVSVQESTGMTKSDLQALLADPRYGKDMAYTESVERKFYEFHGEA